MTASSQTEIEFGDGLRAQEAVGDVDRAVADLVTSITPKEAAWRLGVSAPTLHKKLAREERNQVSLREAVILLVTAPKAQRRAMLEVLAQACGFVVDEALQLTPEQELERLKDLLDDVLAPKQKAELLKKARGR